MRLSGHVYGRMRWFEKIKLYFIRKRYVRVLRKLDRALTRQNMKMAYKYEERMYECDEHIEDFIHRMNLKYA